MYLRRLVFTVLSCCVCISTANALSVGTSTDGTEFYCSEAVAFCDYTVADGIATSMTDGYFKAGVYTEGLRIWASSTDTYRQPAEGWDRLDDDTLVAFDDWLVYGAIGGMYVGDRLEWRVEEAVSNTALLYTLNSSLSFLYSLESNIGLPFSDYDCIYLTDPEGSGIQFDYPRSVLEYISYISPYSTVTLMGTAYKLTESGAAALPLFDSYALSIAKTYYMENPSSVSGDLEYILWLLQALPSQLSSGTAPVTGCTAEDITRIFTWEQETELLATTEALAALGECPSEEGFARAWWFAQYSLLGGDTSSMDNVWDYAKVQASDLTSIEKAFLYAIFSLSEKVPPNDLNSTLLKTTTGRTDVVPPIDAATAVYALRAYLELDRAGITTDYLCMSAWKYKLQATMGLASGVLDPQVVDPTADSAVTSEEVANFIYAAYVKNLPSTIYGYVQPPDSVHLGVSVVNYYYYYLVLCYQEFGYYSQALVPIIGDTLVASPTTFRGEMGYLTAISSLYEALSWADDTALWQYWANDPMYEESDATYTSLKEIYTALAAIQAFDSGESYDASTLTSAMRYFFGYPTTTDTPGYFQLSDYMLIGIEASAASLPMKTNLYDPYTYTDIVGTDWLLNFHSKFGYNRKALYIDTTADAALTWQRTGIKGNTRVCTLEDLIYADKDIVLYLDDNLYNVEELSELIDKTFDRVDNLDSSASPLFSIESFQELLGFNTEIAMSSLAKTAEVTTYAQSVMSSYTSELATGVEGQWSYLFPDLNGSAAAYLSPDTLWDSEQNTPVEGGVASTYTPLTALALLSAVYSDSYLFSALNTTLNQNTPVFISSPTLPYSEESSATDRNTVFNYLLLKNLDSQMSVDYTSNLDMTSPVYMDIYGNVVTESGLVVIPAAANATLWNSGYTPYTAAFFSTYGDDYFLSYDEDATALNSVLESVLTPVDGFWQLTSVQVMGGNVDMSKLSTADKDSLSAVADVFAYDLSMPTLYSSGMWQMLITEVLRGAPVEYIDKEFEGLSTSDAMRRAGLLVASKLEDLLDALSGDEANSSLVIPNPAYMDGIEYVIFFAYKILILLTIIIWMITIYADAVGGGISLRTAGKCIGAVLLVLSLIVGIPSAFEISYYQANKLLLQDEAEYLMMLNLEKKESGQEIGVTEIREPTTSTTLYLELAETEIPWWDLLPKILISSSALNLEELYAEYEGQHLMAVAEDMTVINDGIYISTDTLFDSSSVTFSPTSKKLFQQATGDTPASYYTPYYYFLDQIIDRSNDWADSNSYYSYSTKIQRGGKLKTLGYIQPYFTSEEFMSEGMDFFGLYTLYDVPAPREYDEPLNLQLDVTRESQWCNLTISSDERISRIQLLNEYAQEWVAKNRELLGKVTDETFLKCFALACAMEHNRLFNTMRADSLDVYELSDEDLMRLSIADTTSVMQTSTMSYPRFVFTVGGSTAVYLAALLAIVSFVRSWVVPLVTLLVFFITCVSVFVLKLVLRKGNNSIYGYICTIGTLCAINILSAGFTKLTMYVPALGLTPTVCILIQILLQCAYICALLCVVRITLRDWQSVGYADFSAAFNRITREHEQSTDTMPHQASGWGYYDILKERQERRKLR